MWSKKPSQHGRGVWRLLAAAFLIGAAFFIFIERQEIADRLSVWQYEPNSEISSLASRADMSDRGQFYFYASQPHLMPANSFNKVCADHDPEGATLGCYRSGIIYLYDITDDRLEGIREVTAAHEMLHAVYARLDEREKREVNQLIDQAYEELQSDKLAKRLKLYDRVQPGTRYVELHAIIGTEYENIPEQLEAHYAEYFNDRSKVVSLYDSYITQFTAREDRASKIESDISALAASIESESARYYRDLQALRGAIESFNSRASSVSSVSERNALLSEREGLISRTSGLEARRTEVDNMIAEYNALAKEYNDIAIEVQELYKSIDSLAPAPNLEASV